MLFVWKCETLLGCYVFVKDNKLHQYLHSIPRYEYANMLGANWLTTERYPSKQLVWATGDACLIALIRWFWLGALHNFSNAIDPVMRGS